MAEPCHTDKESLEKTERESTRRSEKSMSSRVKAVETITHWERGRGQDGGVSRRVGLGSAAYAQDLLPDPDREGPRGPDGMPRAVGHRGRALKTPVADQRLVCVAARGPCLAEGLETCWEAAGVRRHPYWGPRLPGERGL
ncbi:hypothetical protein NDU88_011627 [Pleurodeles waltl]|uniref:Uncharacterized protein n=1 Tax=Pleurodeles waltl TaxID=8319 RepID=A0AAV7S444_PLEWA|nr:hypothetical protein NDU88_011627 [Pleurodeles waltl]